MATLAIAYPLGAIRITRTPGRLQVNSKNCVNLEDVVHKNHLVSACIFSFFIGQEELFDHLPLSSLSYNVPIYIGRDANMDPILTEVRMRTGLEADRKLTKKVLNTIAPILAQKYRERFAQDYHAFYAYSASSSHSKILVLVYPDFLRVVITSCNMMDIDTIGGDNHWYIHDMPKLSSQSDSASEFETDLLAHLHALGTPSDFIDSIRGWHDYAEVGVRLVTSVPGVQVGDKAGKYGLLRLRRVLLDLGLKLPENSSEDLRLEVCTYRSGHQIVLPHRQRCQGQGRSSATNIGCHIRPWDKASAGIKNIFHHYESKDTGRLFHQKFILAYNPTDPVAPPYYVYVGSANLSPSAWGSVEVDAKAGGGSSNTCGTKLLKMSNFECGVVIPGHLIQGLLEPGTVSWQDGIVPYVQDTEKYDLSRNDRPWNDPRWAQSYIQT